MALMAALDAADRLTPASGSSTGPLWSILTVGLGRGCVCGPMVWCLHMASAAVMFGHPLHGEFIGSSVPTVS